jgi:hypothetical protein
MKKFTFRFLALSMFLLMGTWMMGQTVFTVTFNVDMTAAEEFNPDTDEVYISGSFANWTKPGDDATYRMEPAEPGSMTYTITLPVDSGLIMYKYFRVINNEASWDNGEWAGDPNRVSIVMLDNFVYNDTWGTKPLIVTFNVDASSIVDTTDWETNEMYITGSFSGWAMPGLIPELKMNRVEDSNIFTFTGYFYAGDYEYKYFLVENNTPSWGGGEWDGGDNRAITIEADTTVNDVWGSMAGIVSQKADFNGRLYPNPVTTTLNIEGVDNFNNIKIFDMAGKVVYSQPVSNRNFRINVSNLNKGVYIVNLYNDKGVQTTKFVKK